MNNPCPIPDWHKAAAIRAALNCGLVLRVPATDVDALCLFLELDLPGVCRALGLKYTRIHREAVYLIARDDVRLAHGAATTELVWEGGKCRRVTRGTTPPWPGSWMPGSESELAEAAL